MTAERSLHLFVYGSLLSGESRHSLLDGARCLGESRTPPSFDLIDLGPLAGLVADGSTIVHGELYEVPIRVLATIDVQVEHPVFFKRTTIELSASVRAETYLLDADQVRGRRRVRSGDWRTRFAPRPHRSERSGAVAPSARDSAFVRWARDRHRS